MVRRAREAFVFVLVLAVAAACTPAAPKPLTATAPKGAIVAGASGDYPPFSVWTADAPDGFAPALLTGFAASAKRPIEWTRFTWTHLQENMQAGAYDVVADGLTVRPERSVLGRFTVPLARGGAVMLLRRPSWATTPRIDELDRPSFRVAVNRGAHLERVTRGLFHQATIQTIPDNTAVRAALANGEADAVMTNTFEAPRWAEGLAGVESVGPLTRDLTALWVRADRRELAEDLDEWLLGEEASGRLETLRQQRLGRAGGGPTAVPLDALLAAISERLSLMPFVAAAKGRSGRDVTDPAQEARVIAAALAATSAAAKKHGVAPPPEDRSRALFVAQIEAAKEVQSRATSDAKAPAFDLETQLRPAIARITAKIAFLVVRLPAHVDRHDVVERTRDALGSSGVGEENTTRLGTALADLCDR